MCLACKWHLKVTFDKPELFAYHTGSYSPLRVLFLSVWVSDCRIQFLTHTVISMHVYMQIYLYASIALWYFLSYFNLI